MAATLGLRGTALLPPQRRQRVLLQVVVEVTYLTWTGNSLLRATPELDALLLGAVIP